MTTESVVASSSRQEESLTLLQRATQEVFEIMLACTVPLVEIPDQELAGGFTAIVGLAGALCGLVTVRCSAETASDMAKAMLGEASDNAHSHAVDALGEMCNMIAGNFKNKLAGTDERCMLSVPSIISGGEYKFHSLVHGPPIEVVVLFEDAPISVCLQLKA